MREQVRRDFDLPFAEHDTIEIMTEHAGADMANILVGDEERDRYQRTTKSK
jgi:hypothetical protein